MLSSTISLTNKIMTDTPTNDAAVAAEEVVAKPDAVVAETEVEIAPEEVAAPAPTPVPADATTPEATA
jgi:hypothetical protein